MKKALLFLVALLIPSIIFAENATIRAGEHDSFTRLVIDIPTGANWQLSRTTDGYGLTVPGVDGFRTNDIFRRIPATRISAVTSDEKATDLAISLACDCHATAFLWRPEKLVIDINDGKAEVDSPFETSSVETRAVLPIVLPNQMRSTFEPALLKVEINSDAALVEPPMVSQLEKIVIEGLARGATQGLLTPSSKSDIRKVGSLTSGAEIIGAHFEQNKPSLLAHTSIDAGRALRNGSLPNVDNACLPNTYFDLENWGGVGGFSQTIGPLQSKLTNDFYEVNYDDVNELAKAYLFFGFGREARAVLTLDSEMSQQRKVLDTIGALIDDEPTGSDILAHQVGCDSGGALWAFLENQGAANKGVNTNSVLRVFRGLPVELQSHLSPRLSQKFADIDDLEAAALALSIEEFVPNTTLEAKLAKTEVASKLDHSVVAADVLGALANENSRITASGLVDYFESAMDAGTEILPEELDLADILRFEHSGEEVVGRLAVAQVNALIINADIERAFAVLDEEEAIISLGDADELRTAVVMAATEKYTDEKFLNLAFSQPLEDANTKSQNVVSRRLLSMGLAERASLLLAGPTDGEEMAERRYLRAQAALEIGQFSEVLENLVGLSTVRANKLRESAEIRMQPQNTFEAVSIGDNWRMGNWAALAQSQDELLRTVSLSVLDAEAAVPNPDKPLATGQALIEDSKKTRKLLEDVFGRFAAVTE